LLIIGTIVAVVIVTIGSLFSGSRGAPDDYDDEIVPDPPPRNPNEVQIPQQVMVASAALSRSVQSVIDVETFGSAALAPGFTFPDAASLPNGGAPFSGPTFNINGVTYSSYSFGQTTAPAAQGRWSGTAYNDFGPPAPPQAPPEPPDNPQGPEPGEI
jgi:hypothetical protein